MSAISFLNEIIKIFGLDLAEDEDHEQCVKEVKIAMKKHLNIEVN